MTFKPACLPQFFVNAGKLAQKFGTEGAVFVLKAV
jgi:hypothetical protein